jgi:hypothetical protein
MTYKPSIDEVARHAGVSIATVSRVLTGSKPVADATRQRVQAAIDALNYRASPFGRGLSTGRSRLLVVLVPTIANPYYAEIVRGAASCASAHGYTALPVDLEGVASDDNDSLQMLAGMLADGVINLVPLAGRPRWLDAAHSRPWVNCSEFLAGDSVPYVSIDHALAAIEAVPDQPGASPDRARQQRRKIPLRAAAAPRLRSGVEARRIAGGGVADRHDGRHELRGRCSGRGHIADAAGAPYGSVRRVGYAGDRRDQGAAARAPQCAGGRGRGGLR